MSILDPKPPLNPTPPSWREKYNVWYGDRHDTPGEYGELLKRSRYCLALPGDGWSARFEDALLHGCIPVIIMDNVQVWRGVCVAINVWM